jgi:hypothetical protein
MGHSWNDIARITNKALFDYGNGLSAFEKQVAKRIVPFYSFQRFATPLIAQTLVNHPGRINNLEATAREFFKTWNKQAGGDSLSPSERAVLPGYLTEQPHVYENFDSNLGKFIFRTFNNFSPLDLAGTMEWDQQGKLDLEGTIQKMGLAQLTPVLKVPLELAMDKNFFSGQAISREGNPAAGKIGKVTPEAFLGNLASIFIGKGLGLPAALLFKGATDNLTTPAAVQAGIKTALGWETSSTDGKVYINPYLAYGLSTAIPSLNQVLRANDPERHPYEKVLDTFFGIGTQKVDLQQSRKMEFNKQGEAIRTLQTQIRRSIFYGRYDEVDSLRKDMQDLLAQIYAERAAINPQDIRGGAPMTPATTTTGGQ